MRSGICRKTDDFFDETARKARLRKNLLGGGFSLERPRLPQCILAPSVLATDLEHSEPATAVYLTDIQVAQRYGISRASVWRWVRNTEDFPAPKKLSQGTTRWAMTELLAFEKKFPRDQKPKIPSSSTTPGDAQ